MVGHQSGSTPFLSIICSVNSSAKTSFFSRSLASKASIRQGSTGAEIYEKHALKPTAILCLADAPLRAKRSPAAAATGQISEIGIFSSRCNRRIAIF
jgi:hypothetical protein